ncbi:hypothetical protein ACQ8YR_001792 [Yersinia enterocolitica]|uniref:hypothetical protein n=1 Tax=Yersinia enterocolitica TaxID=630 RepID=UPI00065A75F7|nr:hypothetical protein [Yersinia enterocolitica]OVZ88425.1 hypothetical protein CBW54_09170 [Yersinia kristensenii]EKN3459823.1 hypothetical protein [Yersinia enterocolitica]EKN5146911.1 hypothetical protein [Yersinia enterocolitica]CRX53713.1 Uncharacterised protein [Yersinia enterocolitica]HDL7634872.1 hypothetical protein [Yersinia enterocolitica]
MKFIGGIIITLVIIFSAYLGKNVPFANQWPLYEALRTTASIIFAVVGAWFAIIYPERLKKSFLGGGSSSDSNGSGITRLFTPIVHSTAILATVLVIGVVAPLVKQFGIVSEHKEFFRGLSYAVLVFLTLWQLLTVLFSLIGPDMVKRHNSEQERSKQAIEAIMPKNSKKN